jgi:hypothetical protein
MSLLIFFRISISVLFIGLQYFHVEANNHSGNSSSPNDEITNNLHGQNSNFSGLKLAFDTLKAVSEGDEEKVKKLLEKAEGTREKSPHGITPLMLAATTNAVKAMSKVIIKRSPYVEHKYMRYCTSSCPFLEFVIFPKNGD